MNLTLIHLIEIKIAIEQRIDLLEKRVDGAPPKDMPYSHKALADMREAGDIVHAEILITKGEDEL